MPRTIEEIDRNLRLLSQLLLVTTVNKQRIKLKKQIDDRLEERYEVEYGREHDTLHQWIEAATR